MQSKAASLRGLWVHPLVPQSGCLRWCAALSPANLHALIVAGTQLSWTLGRKTHTKFCATTEAFIVSVWPGDRPRHCRPVITVPQSIFLGLSSAGAEFTLLCEVL